MSNSELETPILSIENVSKRFVKSLDLAGKIAQKLGARVREEIVHAVDGVSIEIKDGEVVGLVGESGCGKSTLAKTLVYLDPATSGEIFWKGEKINSKEKIAVNKLRKDIQFIFQDPYAALHPYKTIGAILEEVLFVHYSKSKIKNRNRVIDLLKQVDLPLTFAERHPHELSGGQRQRVVIARALAVEPKVLICDESVAALDISVQAQVLNLLNDLKQSLGLSYLFISHDLAVVKYMSDRVMVMEEGTLVELQEADTLYQKPQKAYTQKLIDAIP